MLCHCNANACCSWLQIAVVAMSWKVAVPGWQMFGQLRCFLASVSPACTVYNSANFVVHLNELIFPCCCAQETRAKTQQQLAEKYLQPLVVPKAKSPAKADKAPAAEKA